MKPPQKTVKIGRVIAIFVRLTKIQKQANKNQENVFFGPNNFRKDRGQMDTDSPAEYRYIRNWIVPLDTKQIVN